MAVYCANCTKRTKPKRNVAKIHISNFNIGHINKTTAR